MIAGVQKVLHMRKKQSAVATQQAPECRSDLYCFTTILAIMPPSS